MTRPSPRLIQAVRSALDRLQRSEELASDDPALAELKGSVLSKIAELEVDKTPPPPAAPKRILWISKRTGKLPERDAEVQPPAGAIPGPGVAK